MFLSAQAPRFSTWTPGVLNNENELTVSLPILNIGDSAAANVRVTGITLGSATRLSPAGLPIFIGDLGEYGTDSVAARFDASGLAVGGKYLFTIQGTYESGGATYGFAVNRYIVVPTPSHPEVVWLRARVEVAVEPGIWTYTIFNDEPPDNPQFITTISLDVVAPVTVTGVPEGWEVETDNATYVLWYATDLQLPYPHHIAPGRFLGGFQIQSQRRESESTAYVVTGWNHQSDEAGLVSPDVVLSPSRAD